MQTNLNTSHDDDRPVAAENESRRDVPLLKFTSPKHAPPGYIITPQHISATSLIQFAKKKWTIYLNSLVFLLIGLLVGKQHGVDDVAYFLMACLAVIPMSKVS